MPKRVGIFQLAITLIALGVAIVLTKLTGTDWLGRVLSLWPLVLIAVGGEIVWRQTRARNGGEPDWKLDGKSLVVLTLVLGVTGALHSLNSVAASLSKDGLWGIMREWEGVGPNQTVPVKDEILDLAGAESIFIENPSGKLRVEGTDENRVRLRADANIHILDRAAAEERAKAIGIRIHQGKEASIIVEDRGAGGGNRASVNLLLQVPKNIPVSSKSRAGEVEMTGVAGVGAETDMGRVSVQNVRGTVKVRTHAGEIEVTGAGSADLESDMGRVRAENVAGSVRGRTRSGRLEVRTSDPVGGNWDLQTNTGAISLAFPADSSVKFEGKTGTGVITGPDINFKGPEGGPVSKIYGEGKYLIFARTDTGGIEIGH